MRKRPCHAVRVDAALIRRVAAWAAAEPRDADGLRQRSLADAVAHLLRVGLRAEETGAPKAEQAGAEG